MADTTYFDEPNVTLIRDRTNARPDEKKWQPGTWTPEYEYILTLHCQGKTNTAIAEMTGYCVMHVGHILSCKEAKKARNTIITSLRKNTLERMEAVSQKALDRIETVMNDDELFENAPLAVYDRAMSYMKGVNKLAGEGGNVTTNNTQNNVVIGNDAASLLVAALNRSNQVKELHVDVTGDSIN
jgi:hypothetical protein